VGFLSLIAASTSSVLQRASQSPLQSILGVSHALDGLLRHRPCGFISPHSHVQGSPSRGFPPHPARPPRRWPVPSRRWCQNATDGCPSAPRPVTPPTGLCSGCGSVARPSVVSRRPSPIPSWDFPPPGSLARHRGGAFTSPPLMAFRKKPSQSFSSLTCSVSPMPCLACLSRGCRPARGS
jgi:hypothetical protein